MSGYSSSVTGDENGRSRGVGEGVTTITVIHGFGEDRIEVRVDAPMVGDTQVIGQDGGIIQNSDGVQVSFGPDQLDEDTTVEVVSVAKDRTSVVEGKSVAVSVDLGGRRIIKQKTKD